MLESFLVLQHAANQRDEKDIRLINWWLMTLVLSIVTFGIYLIYILYMRIKRRDEHFDRIRRFMKATIDCTEEYANRTGQNIEAELKLVREKLDEARQKLFKPKDALFWVLLLLTSSFLSVLGSAIATIVMTIATFYVLYFLTVDWYRLQRFEQEIVSDLNLVWTKLGLLETPIKVQEVIPNRSYMLYLFLSFITFGLWTFPWDYAIHNDPHRLFDESKRWETEIVSMFHKASEASN